jgi:hypothetical protein
MAFNTTVRDRHLEEMRYRNNQAFDERGFPAAYAPLVSNAELHGHQTITDARVGLTRRFTTDSMLAPQGGSVWDSSRAPRHEAAELSQMTDLEVAATISNVRSERQLANNLTGASESSTRMFRRSV